MAGYKATPRTILLQFEEGHPHHGAIARVRGMTFGEWEDAGTDDDKKDADRLAEKLVSWNLTDDDGQPVPPTREGLRVIDTGLLAALVKAWIEALQGVHAADPLPESSTSGDMSLVESVPMEALSPSLAS